MSVLNVVKNQLKRLGDEDPQGDAQLFLNLLNIMFGKTRYTNEQFEEAYEVFIDSEDAEIEFNRKFIETHFCYKPPVIMNGIKVEKRDHAAEWRKMIEEDEDDNDDSEDDNDDSEDDNFDSNK